jgi:hypothetical protein
MAYLPEHPTLMDLQKYLGDHLQLKLFEGMA